MTDHTARPTRRLRKPENSHHLPGGVPRLPNRCHRLTSAIRISGRLSGGHGRQGPPLKRRLQACAFITEGPLSLCGSVSRQAGRLWPVTFQTPGSARHHRLKGATPRRGGRCLLFFLKAGRGLRLTKKPSHRQDCAQVMAEAFPGNPSFPAHFLS